MEGGDFDIVAVLTNEIDETGAHFFGGAFGESEGENSGRIGVGFGENIGDTDGQNLGFSRSRSGHNHDRTIEGIDGFFLIFVKR